jgi:hypothetical protein
VEIPFALCYDTCKWVITPILTELKYKLTSDDWCVDLMLPSKHRLIRIIVIHGTAVAGLLLFLYFYNCPIHYFLQIRCPGCGIVSAHKAALSLDFIAAFRHHPLFFVVAPVLMYSVHKKLLKRRLSDKTETIVFFSVTALFLATYIFSLIDAPIRSAV